MITKFKPTKWANHKFSDDENEARAMWKRAQKQHYKLGDMLHSSPENMYDREYMHMRLDILLDNIERTREAAKKLFPEVSESFSISSMKV